MPSKNIELIQQWQTLGKVPPELLRGKAFETCKKVGLTSLQSYVYWAEIEKRPGVVDFSTYDEIVEKIRKHGLKWVPFLIIGPYYATPKWFQRTRKSIYAKCLEHGRETRIQSIWNPNLPKYVDRFLRLFSNHYRNSSIIESVELGISGSWGETLYPTDKGFIKPHESFHVHPGWWCGDKYAVLSFKKAMKRKYRSIEKLNTSWNEKFRDFKEIEFPNFKPSFSSWCMSSMKNFVKFGIKTLQRQATIWDRALLSSMSLKYPSFKYLKNKSEQRRWVDFVRWYLDSMVGWADFWIRKARNYLPTTKIYLATGGDGNALLGADFSAQAKIAAKHKSGIRITNQEDSYERNFSMCRLVSSSCRHYGAYFTTEEAWYNSPHGVTTRIFDAATSGAKGIYFKSIINGDTGIAFETQSFGEPTQNTNNFVKNIHYLTGEKPIIEVAALVPNTSIALDFLALNSIYSKSSKLRDVSDLDFVDENMIVDNALKKYRFLVLLGECCLAQKTSIKIIKWIETGGILVSNHKIITTIDGGNEFREELGCKLGEIKKIKRGYTITSDRKGTDYLEFVREVLYNRDKKYPWRGIPEIDGEWDGVYATRFCDRIAYFNSTNSLKIKKIRIKNSQELKLKILPHSMAELAFQRA